MPNKYQRFIVFALAILMTSCLKARHQPLPNYPISGKKWQEVKLWIYHKTYHGLIFSDTTYTRSAFDTLDYAQFFNDGSVSRSSQYYYSLHDVFTNGNGTGPYFSVNGYFVPWRSSYLIHVTGFNSDTVYYNGRDSLRIHSFQKNSLYYDEMDAYYTR